jgi:hypothetical protein
VSPDGWRDAACAVAAERRQSRGTLQRDIWVTGRLTLQEEREIRIDVDPDRQRGHDALTDIPKLIGLHNLDPEVRRQVRHPPKMRVRALSRLHDAWETSVGQRARERFHVTWNLGELLLELLQLPQ